MKFRNLFDFSGLLRQRERPKIDLFLEPSIDNFLDVKFSGSDFNMEGVGMWTYGGLYVLSLNFAI